MRVLHFLGNKLSEASLDNVNVVTARVPVIRCFDREHRIPIDVTLSESNSVVMSRFIRQHLSEDVRVWEVAMFVKHWSQRRDISNTQRGFLNSIGWTILTLWFLQHVSPPVCPFYAAQNVSSRHDARDVIIRRVPWTKNEKSGVNPSSTEELIGQFFQFYINFDFKTSAVSLRYQEPMLRSDIDRLRSQPMFIENPLSASVNLAGGVHSQNLRFMEKEIRRAHHSVVNTGNLLYICATRAREATEL
jgi:DNA polymerase sigma